MRKIVSSAEIKGCLVPENIPDAEDANDLIVYCARVSNPSNQDNFATGDGLLRYCMKKKHVSIFNMANVVIEVNTPRDISRQILRHVSMHFQEFCVAKGTKIRTKTGLVPIENLYNRFKSPQYSKASNWLVRVYDQDLKTFKYAKIKEVFETGVKPVFRTRLDNGKEIVTTKDHKFFTPDGFKTLEDLQPGDFVGTDGTSVETHRQKTKAEREIIRKTIRYSVIASIEPEGDMQTYDLEVDHVDHNYVANGIVTHNSQRYANVNELGFVTREARKQHPTNRQMSIPLTECPEDVLLAMRWAKAQKEVQDLVTKHYNWAIGNGIAKECARVILPEGNTMSRMYINATLRDWFFYCAVRLMDGVQQEHIDVANQCYELLVPRFPWFADAKEYFANE